VVLPAPLGPAMMMIFFNFQIFFKRFYGLQCDSQTKPAVPKKLHAPQNLGSVPGKEGLA
jgi:hypothetical protein